MITEQKLSPLYLEYNKVIADPILHMTEHHQISHKKFLITGTIQLYRDVSPAASFSNVKENLRYTGLI